MPHITSSSVTHHLLIFQRSGDVWPSIAQCPLNLTAVGGWVVGNRHRLIISPCPTKHWPTVDWRTTSDVHHCMSDTYISRKLSDDRWRLSDVRPVIGVTPVRRCFLWSFLPRDHRRGYVRPLHGACCCNRGLFGRWGIVHNADYHRSTVTYRPGNVTSALPVLILCTFNMHYCVYTSISSVFSIFLSTLENLGKNMSSASPCGS
jgi:hypothetical protein